MVANSNRPQKYDVVLGSSSHSPIRRIDYANLRSLLIAQQWAEADIETDRLMVKIAGREAEGYLDFKQIESFPISELKTIDSLWTQYSKDRFGFSVQQRIYQSLGGNDTYNEEIWEQFGDRIGWVSKEKRYLNLGSKSYLEWKDFDKLTFNLDAPMGHFPWCRFGEGFVWDNKTSSELWRGTLGYITFISRSNLFKQPEINFDITEKANDVFVSVNNKSPSDGLILGGLEGVQRRLESEEEEIRIAALSEAKNYEKAGLDLIITALEDKSPKVFQASYSYLKNKTELNIKEALQKVLPLDSSENIDYSKLRDLLIDGKWLKADRETANLLLKVRDRQKKGWLRPEADINEFPCEDLYTIDQLWVKLSGGKFGFSVQADIWNKLGNNLINIIAFDSPSDDVERKQIEQAWINFGEVVGWRINGKWKEVKKLNFNLEANTGHLPMPVVHWHFNGLTDKGFPSKPIWMFAFWLSTGFGTEGNGRMANASLWISFLLNRMNQCAV